MLSDVRQLSTGDLALSITLPAGRQIQAWRMDPRSGALRPVLTDAAGTRLAVTPDGQRVAFLGYEIGPAPFGGDLTGFGSVQPSMVWVVSRDARRTHRGMARAARPGRTAYGCELEPDC